MESEGLHYLFCFCCQNCWFEILKKYGIIKGIKSERRSLQWSRPEKKQDFGGGSLKKRSGALGW